MTPVLAAVIYDRGFPIDDFMRAVAHGLAAEGFHVGGVFQENFGDHSSPCSSMTLVDLSTGERFDISQDLGVDARSCRLDPRGLVEAGARLDAAVRAGVDLLVLNKFGVGEAEGGGLRSTFAAAIEHGVPVLTAVRPAYGEAWRAFHGGLAADLPPDLPAVLAWCRAAARLSATNPATKRTRALSPLGRGSG
jgi:hypothetical protein